MEAGSLVIIDSVATELMMKAYYQWRLDGLISIIFSVIWNGEEIMISVEAELMDKFGVSKNEEKHQPASGSGLIKQFF